MSTNIAEDTQGSALSSDAFPEFDLRVRTLRRLPFGRRTHVVPAIQHVDDRYQSLVKPAIDRVGAALLLTVTAPLMIVLAVVVALGVGRPVIFRQTRVGRDGRLFTVYKFATMTRDRRQESAAWVDTDRRICHKREDDPRLTPSGRFLRRWSLDELPQLWNVLRGDMSLVGPRPELPMIVAGFAPWQHNRHAVKPGLTGYWQVYARGDGAMMHEHTELDVNYVREISFWTDMKVLLMTIPALTGLRKGY